MWYKISTRGRSDGIFVLCTSCLPPQRCPTRMSLVICAFLFLFYPTQVELQEVLLKTKGLFAAEVSVYV